MDLSKYENILNEALRQYTTELDHIITGDMYRSIDFRITTTEISFNISLSSTDYIVYLDDGDFIDNFYRLPSTEKILDDITTDFSEQLLEDMLKK